MVTIKDVARAAGVSVATVSRVYTGSELVREQTVQRVREVAQRLGYSPHGAARSLITSRTSTIGVLLPDLYGEFFSEVIRGIDQTARLYGYHLLVSSSHAATPELEAALRSMRGRVDGLVVMWPEMDTEMAVRNLPAGFPVVLLNSPVDTATFDVIRIANFDGAYAMVQHFLDLGHRRIAIIRGVEGNYDAEERWRGYRAALVDAGILPSAAYEVFGDFNEAAAFRATAELLRADPRPTAVFAANDAMAIGAMSALREAGLRVPDDVAIGGFDDIPMVRYLDPPLSSVHVDISALGELATLRLISALQDKEHHQHREDVLPTTLVLRRSCGASAPASRPTAPATRAAAPSTPPSTRPS
jgi:LacI family transcriptional regulator